MRTQFAISRTCSGRHFFRTWNAFRISEEGDRCLAAELVSSPPNLMIPKQDQRLQAGICTRTSSPSPATQEYPCLRPPRVLPSASADSPPTFPPSGVDLQDWCDWNGQSWPKVRAVVGHSFRVAGPRESVYTMAANAVLRVIENYDIDPERVGFPGLRDRVEQRQRRWRRRGARDDRPGVGRAGKAPFVTPDRGPRVQARVPRRRLRDEGGGPLPGDGRVRPAGHRGGRRYRRVPARPSVS